MTFIDGGKGVFDGEPEIEGIGSINGLFAGPNLYTGFEDGWYILTCFWENGELIFNPDGAECYELSAINDPAPINNGIRIFPNPSSGLISIENVQTSVEIDFFDMLGNISIITIAPSTMAPIAMAIPPRDMILAVIPCRYIMMIKRFWYR